MNLKYVKYLKDWIEEKLEKICTMTKKKISKRTHQGSESVKYDNLYF